MSVSYVKGSSIIVTDGYEDHNKNPTYEVHSSLEGGKIGKVGIIVKSSEVDKWVFKYYHESAISLFSEELVGISKFMDSLKKPKK